MTESPPPPTEVLDGQDLGHSPSPVGNPPGTGSRAASQRVRELPPPPKRNQAGTPNAGARFAEPNDTSPHRAERGERAERSERAARRQRFSGFAASFVVHFVSMLALALIYEQLASHKPAIALLASLDEEDEIDALDEPAMTTLAKADTRLAADHVRDQAVEGSEIGPPELFHVKPPLPAVVALGARAPKPVDWMLPMETPSGGGGTQGRTGQPRQSLLKQRGGNEQSEAAVARGLRWLRAHQRDDGSWRFDHTKGRCQGLCGNPGTEASTTASTALALLAFLGAGYTHQEGEYQETVQRGLYHLSVRAVVSPHGIDLQDGTMYAQGLATLALCEAYGMTRDPALKDLAQRSVNFILYAQDRKGGGWRYTPGEPGDTTVTGWQFMALKSAQMAGLEVASPSIGLAAKFLDSVQVENGAQYGYMTPVARQSTTAIGLLCRMYTGWRRSHPPLVKGAEYLGQWGPSDEEIYYDYYATQVLCHYGGPVWEKWNRRMRDHLIAAQASGGHEAGSWFFRGDAGSEKGGRLYCTALAVMTLEVYYRYMPLYGEKSVDRGF